MSDNDIVTHENTKKMKKEKRKLEKISFTQETLNEPDITNDTVDGEV